MLSNKMTFSFIGLLTILALAFVVTPAMAAEFSVGLDMTDDLSAADHLQVEHPGDGNITVTVKFGEAAKLKAANVFATSYGKDDKILDFPAVTAAPEDSAAVEVVLTIPVKAATMKVGLRIKAGAVAAANPLSANTSAKLDATVELVGKDAGTPTVYSIKRVGTSLTTKIKPATHPTVQVKVTLSEMPKEFKVGHIDAAEATVTSVAELVPEMETPLVTFLAGDDAPEKLPRKRMMYDEDLSGVAEIADVIASNAFVALAAADTAAVRKAKVDARKMYGGIHRAINEAGLIGTAYKYKHQDDASYASPALTIPPAVDEAFGITTDDTATPRTVALRVDADDETTGAIDAPKKPDKTVAKPTAPDLTAYAAVALYDLAAAAYVTKFNEYAANANMWARYNAYMSAYAAEEMIDDDARAKHYMDNPGANRAMAATGHDMMLYPYLVTLTPKYANKNNIVVKVKAFEDRSSPVSMKYTPPVNADDYMEGVDKLTIMVAEASPAAKAAGFEVVIPKEKRIPNGGYLVLTTKADDSGIKKPAGSDKDEPKANERTPAQLLYNVVDVGLPNLETFLQNGGTIDVVAPGNVIISEIMWGSDASVNPNNNSQWIEIKNNASTSLLTGDKTYKLIFYGPNEVLPAVSTVKDRVGTVGAGGYWAIGNKGQSGRTGVGENPATQAAVVPTQTLVSMQRVVVDGTDDGTMAASWAASAAPALNFDVTKEGERIGSPGAAPVAYPVAPTPTPTPTPKPVIPVAKATEIEITEIMVDHGNGKLPQWIELTSIATGKVSLEGWEMVIDNAIDADVLGKGAAITVSLSGAILDVSAHTGNTGKGQSVLVVAWASARHSTNIRAERVINLATQLNQTRQYQLLSYNGFRITLVPPKTGPIAAFGDVAGNLDEDWELPMNEGSARSSLIRREVIKTTKTLGTEATGWKLASETGLSTGQLSYYGSDEDEGTPGQDEGGPLPVELSHFRPARDKATGAVMITWSTQSELNNAGFFIKRSNQRNGQFQVVNPTMIPGAGTTSEKQSYTYTDSTAQPNVVYYYQIEDVSLDGNRQTLTRGIRLKGHVGAAGKATTLWGELKASNE